MKMFSEPDEGTIMIWIDELSDNLFQEINNILHLTTDELEDAEEDDFKYFADTSPENYNKIKELLRYNDYLLEGWL